MGDAVSQQLEFSGVEEKQGFLWNLWYGIVPWRVFPFALCGYRRVGDPHRTEYGGTAPKFCMFHKRGLLHLPPVEHTKLSSCTVPLERFL